MSPNPNKRVLTPTVLQYEATECGAASLSMILAYYGRHVSLSEVRVACKVTRDGSSAIKILEAARAYGLHAKGNKLQIDKLKITPFPVIIFWKFYHFVVLEGFSDDGKIAYINDPAAGRVRIEEDEFKTSYTGIALTFSPTENFEKGGVRKSVFSDLFIPLKDNPAAFSLLILSSLISNIPVILIAGATSQFTNSFLLDSKAYFGIPLLWIIAIGIALTLCLSAINYTLQRRILFSLIKRQSFQYFNSLFRCKLTFFSQRSTGEIATRLLLGVTIPTILIGQIYTFFLQVLSSAIILLFTFFISWQLSILSLFVITFNISANIIFVNMRSDSNKKLAQDQGRLQGFGLVSLANIQMIKSIGLETQTLNDWLNIFTGYSTMQQRLGQQNSLFSSFALTSRFILNVSIVIVGGLLILSGKFTLGGLIAFQFLQPYLQAPIGSIAVFGNTLQTLDGLLGRIQDLLDEEPDPLVTSLDSSSPSNKQSVPHFASPSRLTDSTESTSLSSMPMVSTYSLQPSRPALDVQTISIDYSFANDGNFFFKDLNIDFPAGSKISIVGPSGCGKSTLAKILAGLVTPTNGQILYGGRPRSSYTSREFSGVLSYVPQDLFLFNASFYENISLWDPDISRLDIEEALEVCMLNDVISKYPDGYNHGVGTAGGKLSGGQKQRIALARSIARHPSILILDEATSALDDNTEKSVIDSLYHTGSTIISIAHRLYAALHSDTVIVMSSGSIQEIGHPDELLSMSSSYFLKLYSSDSK